LVYYEDNKHYQQLHYRNNIKFQNNIISDNNKNIVKENLKDMKNENIFETELKDKINTIINEYKNKILKRLGSIKKNEKGIIIEELVKQGFNYPSYPNYVEGKNLLLFIREYLISKKINIKKPKYPFYITNADIKEQTNLKYYFRRIASNYIVDDNNDLLFKFYIKKINEDNENKNKNKRKKYEYYNLFKMPFIKDINEYILNIHKEMNHLSFEYLRKEFIKREIYYHGITNDIKSSLSRCEICKLKSIKLTKLKDACKIIIFDKPKMRYVGDLTNIPFELKQNTKFNYIFMIVDHFSKLEMLFIRK